MGGGGGSDASTGEGTTSSAFIALALCTVVGVLVLQYLVGVFKDWAAKKGKASKEMVQSLFHELLLLGLVALLLFALEASGAIHLSYEARHSFELVHMGLFFAALVFTGFVLFLVELSERISRRWWAMENKSARFDQWKHLKHKYQRMKAQLSSNTLDKHDENGGCLEHLKLRYRTCCNTRLHRKYSRTVRKVRFAEARYKFILRHKLPKDFSYAGYLRKTKIFVLRQLVEIPSGMWAGVAWLLAVDLLVRGLWPAYANNVTAGLETTGLGVVVVLASVLINWKMKRVLWKISHKDARKTAMAQHEIRHARSFSAVFDPATGPVHGDAKQSPGTGKKINIDFVEDEKARHEQMELFWFGKPVLTLRMLQATAFVGAVCVALAIDRLTQLQGELQWDDITMLIAAAACLGVVPTFLSRVVPMYALCVQSGALVNVDILKEALAKYHRQVAELQDLKTEAVRAHKAGDRQAARRARRLLRQRSMKAAAHIVHRDELEASLAEQGVSLDDDGHVLKRVTTFVGKTLGSVKSGISPALTRISEVKRDDLENPADATTREPVGTGQDDASIAHSSSHGSNGSAGTVVSIASGSQVNVSSPVLSARTGSATMHGIDMSRSGSVFSADSASGSSDDEAAWERAKIRQREAIDSMYKVMLSPLYGSVFSIMLIGSFSLTAAMSNAEFESVKTTLLWIQTCFVAIFIIEQLIKVLATGKKFFVGSARWWHVLDWATIVILGLATVPAALESAGVNVIIVLPVWSGAAITARVARSLTFLSFVKHAEIDNSGVGDHRAHGHAHRHSEVKHSTFVVEGESGVSHHHHHHHHKHIYHTPVHVSSQLLIKSHGLEQPSVASVATSPLPDSAPERRASSELQSHAAPRIRELILRERDTESTEKIDTEEIGADVPGTDADAVAKGGADVAEVASGVGVGTPASAPEAVPDSTVVRLQVADSTPELDVPSDSVAMEGTGVGESGSDSLPPADDV